MSTLLNRAARDEPRLTGTRFASARGGLARSLLLVLLPLILGPLLTFALLIYRQVAADLQQQTVDQLTSLAVIKTNQINTWADDRVQDIDDLAHSPGFLGALRAFRADESTVPVITSRLNEFLLGNPIYEGVMLADAETGVVQASTLQLRYDRFIGQSFLNETQLARARVSGFLLPPVYEARLDDVLILVAAPVAGEAGRGATGLLYGFVRDEQLLDIVAPSPGLGSTGRAYVITADGYPLSAHVTTAGTTLDSEGIRRARVLHQSGSATYADPAGHPVLGVYHWLPTYQLALLVEESVGATTAPLRRFAGIVALISIMSLVVSVLGVVLVTRRLLTGPLQALTEGAQQMAGGDLGATVTVRRRDEIGLLAGAFNSMAADLRGLYQDLEGKVEARTQQLKAAAEVGQVATTILSPDEMLARLVELIRERFGYYHVTVFLLDEAGRGLVVREATGAVGAQLKQIGYRVPVGSNTLVGWVAANRQPRIALDVSGDVLYAQHDLLPETRSEAALPLRLGQNLLGVLDVQSSTLNAFSQADIDVLQTLADQIAIALENGRLFARQERATQLEQRVADLTARLHRSLTLEAILENAAGDLGRAFGAPKVVVRLQPEAEPILAGAGARLAAAEPGDQPSANGNGHHPAGNPAGDGT